jgi:hypothetical protein
MSVPPNYRYDAVRYSPILSERYPFQLVASSLSLSYPVVVVDFTIEEAKDLHNSLGVMLNNTEGTDSV